MEVDHERRGHGRLRERVGLQACHELAASRSRSTSTQSGVTQASATAPRDSDEPLRRKVSHSGVFITSLGC
jgi:hypothetical protein